MDFAGLAAIATILVFVCAGAIWEMSDDFNRFQQEAIQRGYMLHCPDTGALAWRGECGEAGE